MTSGITSGQIAQLNQIAESALRKAILATVDQINPSKEQAQLAIIENGGDLQAAMNEEVSPIIAEVLKRFLLPPEFSDEEVESSFGYLSDYKPNAIVAQTNRLRELFPGVGYANQNLLTQIEKGEVPIPANAEGHFAFPHWSKVAETYQLAVEKVLDLLDKAYGGKFTNYRKGALGPKNLRETSKKVRAMETLQQSQNADIILVPAQFGIRHRGRSVRRARAVMGGNEFGLGAYEIGIMLLTHPDRLKHLDDLWVDCSGDEYSPGAGGGFECALRFEFDGGGLKFRCSRVGCAGDCYGSASGVLPQ